jgi:hypothetical protein
VFLLVLYIGACKTRFGLEQISLGNKFPGFPLSKRPCCLVLDFTLVSLFFPYLHLLSYGVFALPKNQPTNKKKNEKFLTMIFLRLDLDWKQRLR